MKAGNYLKGGKRVSWEDLIQRFWDNVDKKGDDDCWKWLGRKDRDGYGMISCIYTKPTNIGAHRFSWMVYNKTREYPKQLVLHTCDNPFCVNPHHLFLGTPADNMKDMVKKGRSLKGEKQNLAKLTEEHTWYIRLFSKN